MSQYVIKPFSIKFKPLYQVGKYRYKVFYGGRGAGKSHAVVECAVHFLHSCKCRIVCLREIQKSLKESSYQLFVDKIKLFGLEHDFVCVDSEIRCKRTGSFVIFKGFYPDPTRLKGLESFDIAIVEEAENVSSRSWDFLTPTMRKDNSEIWIVFNTRFTTDPTWDFVANPRPRSYVTKINYDENPLLSKAIKEEAEHCKNTDPKTYRWIWEGFPLAGGDNVLISDDLISAGINRTAQKDGVKIAGLDVARSLTGDTSALCIRQGDSIEHLEEWRIDDITELCERVIKVWEIERFEYLFVDVVGVGGGAHDILKKRIGDLCQIRVFNGALAPRRADIYANLRAECWFMLKNALKESLSIPNSKQLRSEMATQCYKFDAKNRYLMESKDEAKAKGIPSPNLCDAICMTFAPLVIATKPKLPKQPLRRSVGYYG